MSEQVIVKFKADVADFEKGQKKVTKGLKDTGVISNGINKSFARLGKQLVAAFAVQRLIQFTKELNNLSGELELIDRRAQVVFGEALPAIEEQARKTANRIGITRSEFIKLASSTQDLLVPLGLSRAEAAKFSAETITLGGALAEFNGIQGGATAGAEILTKALLGERDSLKQLGLAINEADVSARLAEKGQARLTGQALKQAKAIATLELVTMNSTDAINAFADGADTLTAKQAKANAQLLEAEEALSVALRPAFIEGTEFMAAFTQGLADFVVGLENANEELGFFETLMQGLASSAGGVARLSAATNNLTEAERGRNEQVTKLLERLQTLETALGRTTGDTGKLEARIKSTKDSLEALGFEIEKSSKQQDDLSKSTTEQLLTVVDYTSKIQELQKQQKNANLGSAEFLRLGREISQLQEELADRTGKAASAFNQFAEEARNIQIVDIEAEREAAEELKALLAEIENINTDALFEEEEGIDRLLDKEIEAAEKKKRLKEAEKAQNLETINTVFNAASQAAAGIAQISKNRLDQELIDEQFVASQKEDALKKQLDNGIINEQQFAEQKLKIDETLAAKEAEIKTKQAKAAKTFAILTAVLNTAAGITQALANSAPPASFVLAAITGALGAIQIGVAASQPIPQFEEGGPVVGRRHRQGGVLIEAEDGEYYHSRKRTKQYFEEFEAAKMGKLDELIFKKYTAPALQEYAESLQSGRSKSFAENIAANLRAQKFNDKNLINSDKETRRILRGIYDKIGSGRNLSSRY